VPACLVLVPLLRALDRASTRGAIAAGIVYATVLAEVSFLPWLGGALGRYFAWTPLEATLAAAATSAVLGIVHGGALGVALVFRPRGGALLVVWYAALWACWEALRSWLPPYFPGAVLGAALDRSLAVLQLASVTGIAGVTAAVVAANAGVASVLATIGAPPARRSAGLRALATGAGALALATAWGAWRLATPLAVAPGPRVVAVDPAADDSRASTLDALVAATPAGPGPRPDLVLWPESALNLDLAHDRDAWRRVTGWVERQQTTLVTGGVTVAHDHDGGRTRFNSLHLLRPRFGIQSYHKRLLVPLAEAWPALLGEPPAALEPVAPGQVLPVLDGGTTRFGPLICFEIGDASSARALARDGARFLVNASNDAFFRGGEAPHLRWARVRAIETGLPVVRVANLGTSVVLDPYGRVVAWRDPGDAPTVLEATVPPAVATTYVAAGDWFLRASAAIVALGAAASVLIRRRRALVAEAVVGRGR